MIKFHNPEAETAVEDELYNLSHDIAENQGKDITVALLANGFPDSETFVKKATKVNIMQEILQTAIKANCFHHVRKCSFVFINQTKCQYNNFPKFHQYFGFEQSAEQC